MSKYALENGELGAFEQKELKLRYTEPAPDDDGRAVSYPTTKYSGWEVKALPIGNGYSGATVFGLTDRERIQINENTLSTCGHTRNSGTTNMTELYLHFGHKFEDTRDYVRELDLKTAQARVKYRYGDVLYEREYFASYPDRVTVLSLKASGKGNLSFTLEPKMPYREYEKRSGDVIAEGNTVTLFGHLPGSNVSPDGTATVGYEMDFEAQFRVFSVGGRIVAENRGGEVDGFDEYSNGVIRVIGADSAYVIIAIGTNYELRPEVFKGENDKKLDGFAHPHGEVSRIIEAASAKSHDALRTAHLEDYTALFSRVALNLGARIPDLTADKMLLEYRERGGSRYPEELLFAYGRYLHIASSRPGGMPSNLNGIWNRYHCAVCKNGYWSNINTQMNYWPSFNTNLSECFEAYLAFYEAYREANDEEARKFLYKKGCISSPEEPTGPLWSIQTGMTPFIAGNSEGGRDGYGNTPLMAELFWDYYDFTRDRELLEKRILPALLASANYLTYIMRETDEGLYLSENSGSPEQSTTNPYLEYRDAHPDFSPRGSAYDQSLAYSNYLHVLDGFAALGTKEEELAPETRATLARIRRQIDKLSPILVGSSGQVKEFREETFYGEIGEPEHRHISQLCTLVQGSVITESKTPAWIDAAEVTMLNRGHTPHAWADVMRISAWARIGDGDMAHAALNRMLQNNIGQNFRSLLTGIFQVEANLAVSSAISEMLLQSHEDFIALLPALPSAWKDGFFSGLAARGAFTVSARWKDRCPEEVLIFSEKGGECSLKYNSVAQACVTDGKGRTVKFDARGTDIISFYTEAGGTYTVTQFRRVYAPARPTELSAKAEGGRVKLNWNGSETDASYSIYRAVGSECTYALVASGLEASLYETEPLGVQCTYAVTAVSRDGRESRRAHITGLL